MKVYIYIICVFLIGISCQTKDSSTDQKGLVSYVDPFIGTDGKGKTYPGATVPFGMVQLSPDNGRGGWDWIAGYFYPDSIIAGFSHLHLSGTGAGDLYDISFMPTAGQEKRMKVDSAGKQKMIYSKFTHDREKANPGYYQVYLEDYKIDVELTATTRSGLQRYTFQTADTAVVRLDLGYTRNWDSVTDSKLVMHSDSVVEGYRMSQGWASDQRVFFYTVFSEPVAQTIFYSDGVRVDESTANGRNLLGEFRFSGKSGKKIMVKTGISSVSVMNAKKNLLAEQEGFDFEKVRSAATTSWEHELSKITIESSEDKKVQFYTAIYHSMLAPVTFSDQNGEYKGPDGKIHSASQTRYSIFSLWDTFRATHPLFTIMHSDRVPDMINSLLGHYQESGRLPVWEFLGNETDMMLGYHAAPVIAEAIEKGFSGFDYELAYEAMKASAMQEEFGIGDYQRLGYVPHDSLNWSVSRTMEYAFDDWCVASVAKALGKTADYKYFMKRSMNYRNLFDSTTHFFRAKNMDGTMKVPFDPVAYHPEDYAEANAWQYYWFVLQDVEDLIRLTGGGNNFHEKLDAMFNAKLLEEEQPVWISGNIGQYVHGNEPSHHVPYLYQFVDAPHQTERRVRQIMDELYSSAPDGLCGNEDCGQLSAWYIFSAMGFYPLNPVDGRYIIGSPTVKHAEMKLPGGVSFIVNTINQSDENVYVKSVTLNGKILSRNYINHEEIMSGGQLEFEMTNMP